VALHSRQRVTGQLLASVRGLLLKDDAGAVFALDTDDARFGPGQRVTIEGLRHGFDRIDVQWMGCAAPALSLQ
jgi:hypothetical protein